MKTSLLTFSLAAALLWAPTAGRAAFVQKHTIETIFQAAEAPATAAVASPEVFTPYAASAHTAVASKQKKRGFFRRAARWIAGKLMGGNQIIAAILAFFLGELGVHRFYLGYTGIGIIQLLMFVVGFVLSFVLIGIPILIAVLVWVLIDFIRILTGDLQPKAGSYSETI